MSASSTEFVCGACGQRAPAGHTSPQGAYEAAALERRSKDVAQRRATLSGLILGGVFLALAVGCFVLAAVAITIALSEGISSFGDLPAGTVGWPLFGLFWLAIGGIKIWPDVRNRRQMANRKRLRAIGLRGTGTVLESKRDDSEGEAWEAFETVYELKLRVEVEGRHPYDVRLREIPNRGVYPELRLPVLVDPVDPNNVMVDWFARWGGDERHEGGWP